MLDPKISSWIGFEDPDPYQKVHSTASCGRPGYCYLRTYDLYGPLLNALDAGNSITRASGRGLDLEIETFVGPVKWYRAALQCSGQCSELKSQNLLEFNRKL
jgi:hypothetical protein